MVKFRTETDSLGEIQVRTDRYWGAQTQRSLENFPVGKEQLQPAFIKALALVKKAAARSNHEIGGLDRAKCDLIVAVCDEIIAGTLDEHFPLVVWQTGSGTHTNMNLNEVIANRAAAMSNKPLGKKSPIHPNDHVNMSQSSNDIFPTAMHVAAASEVYFRLLPSLRELIEAIKLKSVEFAAILKTGRTHLMDAAPLSLGQEFSAFAAQLEYSENCLKDSLKGLSRIAAGGTAVGTGLNAPREFAKLIAGHVETLLGMPIETADNKFAAIAAHDAIVQVSGCLKLLATALMKISNDIRLLGSGPRCGLGELILPVNEPGSSIMPGKTNPSQCESMAMVAARVIGNDLTITIAGAGGHLQLNTYKPVMIFVLLESITLLTDSCHSFRKRCINGIQVDTARLKEYISQSLMLATALTPVLGYDKVAEIVKLAAAEKTTLKIAAVQLKYLSAEDYEHIVQPEQMAGL